MTLTIEELIELLREYRRANLEIGVGSLINTLKDMGDVVSYSIDRKTDTLSMHNPWDYEPYILGVIITTITVYSFLHHEYKIKLYNSVVSDINIEYHAY